MALRNARMDLPRTLLKESRVSRARQNFVRHFHAAYEWEPRVGLTLAETDPSGDIAMKPGYNRSVQIDPKR